MGALLDDPAVVEHDDPPGLADGREAVGDDDRRAPGQQAAQAGLDAALGVQVDVRRRLVEHEDARVGDERAGEGEQLALAGRELRAALADLGRSPLGSAAMKSQAPTARAAASICASSASGRPKAMLSRDRAAEQEGLLGHDAHLRAQRARGHVAQVVAVDEHAPVGRVVEARDELGEGRLARAGGADERDGLRRAGTTSATSSSASFVPSSVR